MTYDLSLLISAGVQPSTSIPFSNATTAWTSSVVVPSHSLMPSHTAERDTLESLVSSSTLRAYSGMKTSSLAGSKVETNSQAKSATDSAGRTGTSTAPNFSRLLPSSANPKGSLQSTTSSTFLHLSSDKIHCLPSSASLPESVRMISSASDKTWSQQNISDFTLRPTASGSITFSPKVTEVVYGKASSGPGTRAWLGTYARQSDQQSSTKVKLLGTDVDNGRTISSLRSHATAIPEFTGDTASRGVNITVLQSAIISSLNTTTSISQSPTLPATKSSESMLIQSGAVNSTLSNATPKNITTNFGIAANTAVVNATQHNATLTGGPLESSSSRNSTLSGPIVTNSTMHTLLKDNSTSSITFLNTLMPANSVANTTLPTPAPTSTWYIKDGNHSIAVNYKPLIATLKSRPHPTNSSLSAATTSQSLSCSGMVTINIQKLTKTITATTWLNETITLYGNASTPLPELIPPHPACTTTYLPFELHPPNNVPVTSTLLVTKKSPVVIRAPQTVGPIYNIPTTSAKAAVEQAPGSPHQPGTGGSNDGAQVDSPGQVQGQENDRDLSPGSAPQQQVYPEQKPAALPKFGEPNLPLTESGSDKVVPSSNQVHQGSEGQVSVGGDETTSGEQGTETGNKASKSDNGLTNTNHVPGSNVQRPDGEALENGGAESNRVQGTGSNGETSSNGGNIGAGGHLSDGGGGLGDVQAPSTGQASNNGPSTPGHQQDFRGSGGDGQRVNGNQGPQSDGQLLGGQTPDKGDQDDSYTTDSKGSPPATDQKTPVQSGPKGGVPSSAEPSKDGSNGSGEGSNSESSAPAGVGLVSPEGASQGQSGNANSATEQAVPNVAMIDNVPVSIGDSAIAVGSQTFSVGSPATTIIANGQPIVVGPSQIVASGTTVPIMAAITTPPTTSTMIGDVPVVLQPDDIMIGSQAFPHGSSAAFAIYNGQAYSWDAKQLVGPGGTMVAFPSATPTSPRITAGGQVFSVHSSTLRAPGTAIAIPSTSKASSFKYQGRSFTVNPSQLIAPERSITIPPITQPTRFVYHGETFSVDKSQFIGASATMPLSSGSGTVRYGTEVITIDQTHIVCPSTTITLSNVPQTGTTATPSAVTTGGLTFSLGPQAAVFGSTAYSFLPGQTPATVVDHGKTVTLGSKGVQFGDVFVPVPTNAPSPQSYSAVTQGALTFSIAPSAVILGGQTDYVEPSMIPIHTVIGGQTISIGDQGVGLASTTIPLPMAPPNYATVTEGHLTISVASSEVVVKGSTFAFGPDAPATMSLDGQKVIIGSDEVRFPGTTVDLPTGTSQAMPAAVTADGLVFSVGPTNAIIDGTSYAIGSGALPNTVLVGSETVRLGTNGVILPTTTIPPEQTPSAITADGLTFSADATEAIISGTAYAIGSEAIAKTIVIGTDTIGLGTKGIVLPSTTIAPWGNATQSYLSSAYGTASAIYSSLAASAVSAAPPPSGLPATEPQSTKTNVHQGAAPRSSVPDTFFLAALSGLFWSLLGLI